MANNSYMNNMEALEAACSILTDGYQPVQVVESEALTPKEGEGQLRLLKNVRGGGSDSGRNLPAQPRALSTTAKIMHAHQRSLAPQLCGHKLEAGKLEKLENSMSSSPK
ncbi:hypothetical protein ACE6H2_004915 [Prunus campanulata]